MQNVAEGFGASQKNHLTSKGLFKQLNGPTNTNVHSPYLETPLFLCFVFVLKIGKTSHKTE